MSCRIYSIICPELVRRRWRESDIETQYDTALPWSVFIVILISFTFLKTANLQIWLKKELRNERIIYLIWTNTENFRRLTVPELAVYPNVFLIIAHVQFIFISIIRNNKMLLCEKSVSHFDMLVTLNDPDVRLPRRKCHSFNWFLLSSFAFFFQIKFGLLARSKRRKHQLYNTFEFCP